MRNNLENHIRVLSCPYHLVLTSHHLSLLLHHEETSPSIHGALPSPPSPPSSSPGPNTQNPRPYRTDLPFHSDSTEMQPAKPTAWFLQDEVVSAGADRWEDGGGARGGVQRAHGEDGHALQQRLPLALQGSQALHSFAPCSASDPRWPFFSLQSPLHLSPPRRPSGNGDFWFSGKLAETMNL